MGHDSHLLFRVDGVVGKVHREVFNVEDQAFLHHGLIHQSKPNDCIKMKRGGEKKGELFSINSFSRAFFFYISYFIVLEERRMGKKKRRNAHKKKKIYIHFTKF